MIRRLVPLLLATLCGCAMPAQPAPPAASAPALTLQVPAIGAQGLATLQSENAGVQTWVTADGVSFAFRDGLLVGTRGLGFDLMAADVSGPRNALGTGGSYSRRMRWLDSENHAVLRDFACRMTAPVADPARDALRQDEVCQSADLAFSSSYWLRAGRITAARDWIGPELGPVESLWP